MWLIDLLFDGACTVMGPTPLGRANGMKPVIFIVICKGGILASAVRRAFFILTTSVRGHIRSNPRPDAFF